MAKVIKNILENIRGDLKELGFPPEVFTLSGTIYTKQADSLRTGNIRIALVDVLESLETINKKISKVSKLEKRIKKLEAKLKKR